ncbi:dihydropteroate synthase [Paramicrobacterium agarici]|uniref:Dihydropteroate synthase n=1 Tax=Paramicrobacterium agarici TaxID=630514 RepID=A0A2A9DUV6_9MICO|nr:dihydropteroate synthase [Microbacterium agarici]PFG30468.1 dihydropteroate synthase [Microbacterium agarici]
MTLIMGVVNVTPDSFSDGGRFFSHDDAIEHALTLKSAGADLIDVGGESTRPGAELVDPVEEQRRVIPVISALADEGIRVSVDTMHASTAAAAVEAGAQIINDVSGGLVDDDMPRVAAESGRDFVAMHWRGYLTDPHERVHYDDVLADVHRELGQRIDALTTAGVDAERLIVDPGLGFSKNPEHNWAILAHLERFGTLSDRMLIGASRKRFLSTVSPVGAQPAERDPATAAISMLCAQARIWAVRVHNVSGTRTALNVLDAVDAQRDDHP